MFKNHVLKITAAGLGITTFDLRLPKADGRLNTVDQRVVFTVLRDIPTDDPGDSNTRRFFDTTLVRGDFGTWTLRDIAPDGGYRTESYLREKHGTAFPKTPAHWWNAVVAAWQEIDERINDGRAHVPVFSDRLSVFADSCVFEFPGFVDDEEVSGSDFVDHVCVTLKQELAAAAARVYPNGLPKDGEDAKDDEDDEEKEG